MQSSFRTFFSILNVYNRQRELLRLQAWARRKHLICPERLYRYRLDDEVVRLSRYTVQYPTLTRLAGIVHCLNTRCFPPPRYPRRGSASGYRSEQRRPVGSINLIPH
ncbi:MAG: hypothetical protein J0M33_13510 [Anaerolineae bacterium]|nr:hypothetical protein [Anaerolineae bacterium]